MVGLRVFMGRHNLRNRTKIAAAIGVHRNTLDRILDGKFSPSLDTIRMVMVWAKTIDPAVTYEQILDDKAA